MTGPLKIFLSASLWTGRLRIWERGTLGDFPILNLYISGKWGGDEPETTGLSTTGALHMATVSLNTIV